MGNRLEHVSAGGFIVREGEKSMAPLPYKDSAGVTTASDLSHTVYIYDGHKRSCTHVDRRDLNVELQLLKKGQIPRVDLLGLSPNQSMVNIHDFASVNR